jgi:hypothetical protein
MRSNDLSTVGQARNRSAKGATTADKIEAMGIDRGSYPIAGVQYFLNF